MNLLPLDFACRAHGFCYYGETGRRKLSIDRLAKWDASQMNLVSPSLQKMD